MNFFVWLIKTKRGLFTSPFIGNKYISCNDLTKDVIELKISSSKLLLNLSSGAIIFTFTILQYLSGQGKNFNHIFFVKIGWISLCVSILLSLPYLYFLTSHKVLSQKLKEKLDLKDQNFINNLYYSWINHMLIELFQFIFFVVGFVGIVLFALQNI